MTTRERCLFAIRALLSLALAGGMLVATFALAGAATKKASLVAVDQFGGALADAAHSMPSGSRLELNGAWVEFEVGASDAPVTAEVDRLAKECPDKALRESDEDSGFVLCRPDGLRSPTSIGLNSFAYIDRAEGKTRFVHLKAEQELRFDQLIPDTGDAPGFDPSVVPRIPGVERWMSFRDQGGEYQAVFYGGGDKSYQDTLAFYQSYLQDHGWVVRPSGPEEEDPNLMASRGSELVLILASDDCDGTCVTVISSSQTL